MVRSWVDAVCGVFFAVHFGVFQVADAVCAGGDRDDLPNPVHSCVPDADVVGGVFVAPGGAVFGDGDCDTELDLHGDVGGAVEGADVSADAVKGWDL